MATSSKVTKELAKREHRVKVTLQALSGGTESAESDHTQAYTELYLFVYEHGLADKRRTDGSYMRYQRPA